MTEKKAPAVLEFFAFFSIFIIWGTTYLAIAFGLEGFPPFILSAIRFTVSGIIVLCWCLANKQKLPRGYDLSVASISGIVMLVGGTGLVTWSEQYIASGYAAIIIATEPFMFLLLDKQHWQTNFKQKTTIAGLILGFIGIVLFVVFTSRHTEADMTAGMQAVAIAVLFVASLLWVVGSLYSKNKRDAAVTNTATTSVQLIAAGLFSSMLALVAKEPSHFVWQHVNAKAWGGLIYLVVMGSVVAYVAFTWLLTVRPATQVSTHTYINPLVAVVMGWWLAGEHINLMQGIAIIIILAGVVLTVSKRSA